MLWPLLLLPFSLEAAFSSLLWVVERFQMLFFEVQFKYMNVTEQNQITFN